MFNLISTFIKDSNEMINNGINDDFIICPKCHKKRNHNIKECPWCKAAEILKYVEVVHEEYDIEDDSALFIVNDINNFTLN